MKIIPVKLEASHNLFFFGCKHDGSALSSDKAWDKMVDMMCSEYEGCSNNYGIDMGDAVEAITVDDKRFDPEILTRGGEKLPLQQMMMAKKRREPIKDKLLIMHFGNHEFTLMSVGNITATICEDLGVNYGTFSSKMIVKDSRDNTMYRTYQTHGRKSINSTADDPKRRQTNLELTLKRHLKFKAADCVLQIKGHTHKLLVCKPASELYLYDDGEKIKQAHTSWGQNEEWIHPDARWYGNSGAFLKLFGDGMSGYAERAEYDPIEMGWLIAIIRDKKIMELRRVPVNI